MNIDLFIEKAYSTYIKSNLKKWPKKQMNKQKRPTL